MMSTHTIINILPGLELKPRANLLWVLVFNYFSCSFHSILMLQIDLILARPSPVSLAHTTTWQNFIGLKIDRNKNE
jgi:hypothetical protein